MIRNIAGTLGIFGLFVAIVLGMLAAFGFFGPKPPVESSIPPGQEATTETTNERAEQAISVGETVRVGDLRWTVTDAYPKDEVSTYNFPPSSHPGHYVRLHFTVENVSDRPVTLTSETVTLFDAAGTKYLPAPDRNSSYIIPRYNILFNELGLIHPHETEEGKVNIEVLRNAGDFVLMVGDTDPTVSKVEYVDLGF